MKQQPKINAVEKALKIILAFRIQQPIWGVRDLAAHLGFSPATTQRILQTLKNHGFVEQEPDTRHYRLGNVYFSLLDTLKSTSPLSRTALPLMKRLAGKTQETVHLNIIDNWDRICIETIESLQNLKASMPIGSRSPLYAGASSKCLLAFSPQDFVDEYLTKVAMRAITAQTINSPSQLRQEIETIRRQGFATSLGEHNPGLGAISAPVFNHEGTLLGAISLAIPEIRYGDDAHRAFCLEELIITARQFSEAMGQETHLTQSGYPEVI
jgi:DNA-binding IclR family transcriptional regulator